MKEIFKNTKIKVLTAFILGGIIFGSIGITANYLLRAEDVEYIDKDNNSVTVQSAITDLYSKASSGGYGELTLEAAEASGNSISVSYGDDYISAGCIYGTNPNNYTNVGKIVDNKCVMENLNSTTTYYYKVGVLDSSMKLYIGTGQKETASITYLSTPIEVYFNPVTNTTCTDYTEANSLNENKTGCMKWYAYALEGNYYRMLLDHNTTSALYYNYDNDNSVMGERSREQLTIYAGKTISRNEIGYDLSLLTTSTSSGGSGWDNSLNPKLITAEEVEAVTGVIRGEYFNGNGSSNQVTGSNIYAWLFDYTCNCTNHGCNIVDNSTSGYWTSSKSSGNSNNVWLVYMDGFLTITSARNTLSGLRPVITVPSSILNIS